MRLIKVAKFGGSSVADAGQFKKVRDIVRADRDRRYVVVSASGKRFSGDNKITDVKAVITKDDAKYGELILRAGKKRFMRVIVK